MLDLLKSKITQRLVSTINNSRSLKSIIFPIAKSYQNIAGYRKVGLQYDDLLRNEDDVVKESIKRLPNQELQNRIYRQKRAIQADIMHTDALSAKDQMKITEDKPTLREIVSRVEREFEEESQYANLK